MAGAVAELEERLVAAFGTLESGADPVLRPSERADRQSNGAIGLAKRLGRNPQDVAREIVGVLDVGDVCESVEVSGPGFINLIFSRSFLEGRVSAMALDDRLGVAVAIAPKTVIVDYSHPNVAKEMHVGHLRTTVIGDALCRMLAFVGHQVVRQNHIGDWGTPFGMLIEHLVDMGEERGAHELSVGDLTGFYQEARTSFDADDGFKERSRARVVLLQSGDPETLRLWHVLVAESVRYFDAVYGALGVLLTDSDLAGESTYNDDLDTVVADLDDLGLLVVDDGARCVFPPGFTNRQGEPLPLIVQKSDGGYGYAATDLAAVRRRVRDLDADEMLYIVGAPQAQHLQMVFAVARMAGWLPDGVVAEHVAFGNVLGADHRMLKTREGGSVRLIDLLDEAVERAAAAMVARAVATDGEHPDAGADVARMLGIGAVKYADLSTDRTRDYVFDWDRMLAFEGNTGPYLQYAHARVCSIFRRGDVSSEPGPITLLDKHERALGLALLGFADSVEETLATNSPHKLCGYLYDLAATFTAFYEHCRVLVDDAETRRSRLRLSALTAQVLERGLSLLGIEAPERM
jgi:arginyl-tRNA synthetase